MSRALLLIVRPNHGPDSGVVQRPAATSAPLAVATSETASGGYAIQGHAAIFVERLEGSYSAVVGLPLYETAGLLRAQGIALWDGVGAVS